MTEWFSKDSLISIATLDDGQPSVRMVDGYYKDGRDIAYKGIEKVLGYYQMRRYFLIKLKDDV